MLRLPSIRRSLAAAALAVAVPALAGSGEPPEAGERRPNRLAGESSPYLQLHVYNPVDWYPWGAEALARAREEEKPIFLSVGYSTCYWCHVMEREVFSDPEIAELMNRWFVSVKVDREERPELDEIYMTATQMMTGSGGWPNSVFLTPELEPFFAGTYFPPEDRYGRPGFPTVLSTLHEAWIQRREEVEAHAARVAASMKQVVAASVAPAAELPETAAAEAAVAALKASYDAQWGGFGSAPKFPSPSSLFLLWEAAERGDREARRMVLESLRKMGRGAIYDQLDGGFHRYTLDAAWRIPHFEKMLYDNAHLGELLAVAAVAEKDAELERLARGTLDFALSTLVLPGGAFKSAIDAETDAVEGAFYIWSEEELRAVLGGDGFELLAPIFGFSGRPNFEGDRYTLYLTAPLAEHAARLGLAPAELAARLEPRLEALRRARAAREFPLVDDKALADWNGMMIAALARAGRLLGEPRYVEAAARAAGFFVELRDADGVLLHAWREGRAKIRAFLDDYAFLMRGLLALEEATGDERWRGAAERLADEMERRLRRPEGGYYMSEARADLLFQAATVTDGAIPSGNGVALLALATLAERTGKAVYRERAEAGLRAFAPALEHHPAAVATVAQALLRVGGADRVEEREAEAPTSLDRLAQEVVASGVRLSGPPRADGWRPFELEIEIREGWHLNANPASLEFLVPTRVAGAVRALAYPAGESFRPAFADAELSVYSGRTSIAGEIAPDGGALELTYQACDERRCLAPVTRRLELGGGGGP